VCSQCILKICAVNKLCTFCAFLTNVYLLVIHISALTIVFKFLNIASVDVNFTFVPVALVTFEVIRSKVRTLCEVNVCLAQVKFTVTVGDSDK